MTEESAFRSMPRLRKLVAKIRTNTLLHNTGWMFGGYGLRMAIQAVYFLLIARSLGAEQYGAFVAITALVAIMAPFTGFGAPNLLMKNVVRDRSLLVVYWGNGLLMSSISGIGFLLIVLAIARFALPNAVAFATVLLIGLSDLVLVKVTELASMAFMAVETMSKSAQLQVLVSASRLVGIVALRLINPASHGCVLGRCLSSRHGCDFSLRADLHHVVDWPPAPGIAAHPPGVRRRTLLFHRYLFDNNL